MQGAGSVPVSFSFKWEYSNPCSDLVEDYVCCYHCQNKTVTVTAKAVFQKSFTFSPHQLHTTRVGDLKKMLELPKYVTANCYYRLVVEQHAGHASAQTSQL